MDKINKKEEELLKEAYKLLPKGSKNAISINDYAQKLLQAGLIKSKAFDVRREATDILSRVRKKYTVISLNFGIFVPISGDEDHVRHFINRETHRVTEILSNIENPKKFLLNSTGK